MDAANRRTSMEMMVCHNCQVTHTEFSHKPSQINFANSTDAQYILITPQDMSAVQLNTSVRVHRMRDPERGRSQRTPPF